MNKILLIGFFIVVSFASMARAQSRFGECPVVRPGQVGICIQECSNDFECGRFKKCCSNGCGFVCQRACPRAPPCNLQCEFGSFYDVDRSGCKVCGGCRPHPCSLVPCPRGFVCQLVQVQCIVAPCYPIGQCVRGPIG